MLADITDLRQALESDSLIPAFQPIVELRTGNLCRFEVLARWHHPQHGLVLPENFISLAEENGLIEKLTQQMVRKAFQAGAALPEHLELAINISPVQLQNPHLANQLQQWAAEAGFPMHRIMVEITETALVNDPQSAKRFAYTLKDMGCKLALDDFGTGYSSLSHLQAMPFDELKIDRSFVSSMVDQRDSRKIVAAVIGLGHSLGITAVAEGIEAEEQADLLLWFGCELAQGWFYGRPQPSEKIPALLADAPRRRSSSVSVSKSRAFSSSLEAFPAERLIQLQAIYEGVPLGLCFIDRKLRYVSLNQRYADLNGIPMEKHIGRTVDEIIPEVFPEIEEFIHRALSGEAVLDEEIIRPSYRPEGGDLSTMITYQPAVDEAGDVIGISVAVADITSIKQMQEALLSSEERSRVMVDQNPNVPWLLDAAGNVLDVSSRWMEITGLTKEHSLKLGWLDALHSEDIQHTLQHLRTSVKTGRPIDVEYRVWDVHKGWRPMRDRGVRRRDADGNALFWYGTLEDTEERRQMETDFLNSHLRGKSL